MLQAVDLPLYAGSKTGLTLRGIAGGPYPNTAPSWSHDGTWIYFISSRPEGRGFRSTHLVLTEFYILKHPQLAANPLFCDQDTYLIFLPSG